MLCYFLLISLAPLAVFCMNKTVPTVRDVPRMGGCHTILEAQGSGFFNSHDGYPATPYAAGLQCRVILNATNRYKQGVELSIGSAGLPAGLRPWDYAILTDGNVANKLSFLCHPDKYKRLGENGVDYQAVMQRHFTAGRPVTFRSEANFVIMDFCADSYPNDLSTMPRTGFQVRYNLRPVETNMLTGSAGGLQDAADPTCGRAKSQPSEQHNRIVNGIRPLPNSWPWLCGMLIKNRKPVAHACGCTLIAEQWVVTAAHCLPGGESMAATLQIILGVDNLADATDQNKFAVTQLFKHQDFNQPEGLSTLDNDIALLKLDRAVQLNASRPHINTACLPQKPIRLRPFAETAGSGRRICYVAGWGTLFYGQSLNPNATKVGSGSDDVLQIAVEIIPPTECIMRGKANHANGIITEQRQICAGYSLGYYDSCQGDSGGPLVCDDGDGQWTLYGVVSWGIKCARAHTPGVYTNVLYHKKWIYDTMLANSN